MKDIYANMGWLILDLKIESPYKNKTINLSLKNSYLNISKEPK